MAEQNRATLKNYFKAGQLPTEDHFSDLVDSTLNMVDEGFRKSPANGVQISTLGGERALLSFYAHIDPNAAQWSIAYGDDITGEGTGKRLVFGAGHNSIPVMTLDPRGYAGVHNENPEYTLDVKGVLRSAGRIGGFQGDPGIPGPTNSGDRNTDPWRRLIDFFRTKKEKAGDDKGYEKSPVPADGEWHDITGWLTGCQAFEVMAGTGGGKGQGRYALLHAFALNTFNPRSGWFDFLWPRNRIRAHQAYYNNRCDSLELRWDGTSGNGARYRLQIRSRCPYSGKVFIQYSITQLWFDPDMRGATPSET